MPAWSKLDAKFHCNAKVTYLASRSDPICAIVRMISWSNESNSGGKIPEHVASGFATTKCLARLMETAPMAKSPFLHRVDGGYEIHDFDDYCLTESSDRKVSPELSAKRSEAGKKGARAKQSATATDKQVAEAKSAVAENGLLTRVGERAPARSHSLSISESSREFQRENDPAARDFDGDSYGIVFEILKKNSDFFSETDAKNWLPVAERITTAVDEEPTAVRDGLGPDIVVTEAIVATREWAARHPSSTSEERLARIESHAVRFILGDCRAGKRRRVVDSGIGGVNGSKPLRAPGSRGFFPE